MTAYPQPPLLTREGERGHSKIRRMRMGKLVDQPAGADDDGEA